ncbi:predicted protein [Lichtheimia corymbifera JMRC:FSU:9682]|uniref:Uncharacterized protein n=1 Tax=Lichtheimia corymbifera JMRC:FSU:9682 TaxID=1263082 RepID=A0A068S5X7_9FUNG|nr:predicted protein [Lichtheimia corymbifera JMRC:FSU:9682]
MNSPLTTTTQTNVHNSSTKDFIQLNWFGTIGGLDAIVYTKILCYNCTIAPLTMETKVENQFTRSEVKLLWVVVTGPYYSALFSRCMDMASFLSWASLSSWQFNLSLKLLLLHLVDIRHSSTDIGFGIRRLATGHCFACYLYPKETVGI